MRKEKKTYGTTGKIAGAEVIEDEHVLFFDDVVSEGLSKLEGMRSLEKLGARVESVMVVVDREQGGNKTLEDAGYKLHSLSRVSELVDSLSRSNDISQGKAEAVLNYIRRE